ncbi:MAG: ABC transporter permease [Acidimicrobiales bacterium]
MNWILGLAGLAIVVALRVWRGRRNRSTRGERRIPSRATIFKSDVGLVAAREVRERVRGRVFRVGTLLVLAVVAGAIVIPVVTRSQPQTQQVGIVGELPAPLRATIVASASSIGVKVHLDPEASLDAAKAGLRSGRLEAAIVNSSKIFVNKPIGSDDTSTTAQLVGVVSQNLGLAEAAQAAGITAAQLSELAGAKPLAVRSLQGGAAKGAQQTTSIVGLILIFMMLTQYNTWILVGVMEEKSSRVVEVLLAAMRPIQLLTGKVLGIGMVAFAQAALVVAFALGLAEAVGSDLLHGTAPLVLASTLAWLVLGYAFYCWVYAAAGSMVERQDQVQSLAIPLSLPIVFGYVMALIQASSASPSTFFKVLAYLPPTAPFAMPVLVGLRAVTWWEFAASVVISLVCTVGVARVASNVYRRAILRTGRRVQLREIFSRATG